MKKLFSVILLLGSVGLVCAQGTMSLEECRRLAIENNKKLKMADEQIGAAKAKKAEAFTKYLPGIDAMGTCWPRMHIYRWERSVPMESGLYVPTR